MKSVKQQFIDLKEGKMNQAQFMRNVRMTLPHLVTNTTSFDDTVKILRNKAILTEADIKDKNQEKLEKYDQYTYTLNGKEVFPELAFFDNILKAELDDTIYRISEPVNGVVELNPIKGKTGMYTEENENPYFSSDPTDGDRDFDMKSMVQAEEYYEKGLQAYSEGDLLKAEKYYDAALKAGSWLGWTEFDLPPYESLKEADIYGIAGDPEAEAERKAASMSIKPKQTPEEKYGVDKKIDQSELNFLKKIYAKTPTEKIKKMIDDLEQRMSLNESYTTNTSGKELYSKFSEIDNLNGQEVLIGIDYEIEKNNDLTKKEAAKIAIKNLKKNPFYYTDSLMAGKEGYELEYIGGKSANADARQMQLLDKNMSNVVDKKMGMQPVKGIEKDKASANKANKETNKPETGIKIMSLVAKTVRGVKKMDATGEKMKKAALKENQNTDVNALTKKIIDELENRDSYDSSDVLELIKMYQKKYNFSDAIAKEIDDNIFQYNADERYDSGMDDMLEYSTLPGGDNMTDVAGHQMDEAKASSLSVGNKFKLGADLGKFVMGEEVEVVSVEPFGNDIKLVLSNGKDQDDFYLDRNDEI
jgi:hypothetical protein